MHFDSRGPALLLTHGCAMDKPNRATSLPRVEFLQFAALRSLSVLEPNIARRLRNRDSTPYELIYAGETADFGETFVSLTETFHLPATYFSLTFHDFSDDPRSGDGNDGPYVVAGANGDRIGRLEAHQVLDAHLKIIAFWTRQRPAS